MHFPFKMVVVYSNLEAAFTFVFNYTGKMVGASNFVISKGQRAYYFLFLVVLCCSVINETFYYKSAFFYLMFFSLALLPMAVQDSVSVFYILYFSFILFYNFISLINL